MSIAISLHQTKYAALQSGALRKIIMASSAATPAVIATNNLTFGTLPPSSKSVAATTRAVIAAAELCDAPDDTVDAEAIAFKRTNPLCVASGSLRRDMVCTVRGSCRQSLLAGFIYEDSTFPRNMCVEEGPGVLNSLGMRYALNATSGAPLMVGVPAGPTVERDSTEYTVYLDVLETALRHLQEAGVTYVIACTYFSSAEGIVEALYQMNYSPLAVMVTVALSDSRWADSQWVDSRAATNMALAEPWWRWGYILEPVTWHPSKNGTVGRFTQMTSKDFTDAFLAMFGEGVSYVGASQFMSCVALAHAVETADSLDTDRVAAALSTMDLPEFAQHITFNSFGMMSSEMIVTQVGDCERAACHFPLLTALPSVHTSVRHAGG